MINRFRGDHFFLSNFYPVKLEYEGLRYGSSEAAYQAAKTENMLERIPFCLMAAHESKAAGKLITKRENWSSFMKVGIMTDILKIKFSIPELRKMLDDTGDTHLEEGNKHGDTFWGTCHFKGDNHLGRILMRIRDLNRRPDESKAC